MGRNELKILMSIKSCATAIRIPDRYIFKLYFQQLHASPTKKFKMEFTENTLNEPTCLIPDSSDKFQDFAQVICNCCPQQSNHDSYLGDFRFSTGNTTKQTLQ